MLLHFFLQISQLEQNDIIEVDPDTKEMLKLLVSYTFAGILRYLLSSIDSIAIHFDRLSHFVYFFC